MGIVKHIRVQKHNYTHTEGVTASSETGGYPSWPTIRLLTINLSKYSMTQSEPFLLQLEANVGISSSIVLPRGYLL